jgi:hypothetical protein
MVAAERRRPKEALIGGVIPPEHLESPSRTFWPALGICLSVAQDLAIRAHNVVAAGGLFTDEEEARFNGLVQTLNVAPPFLKVVTAILFVAWVRAAWRDVARLHGKEALLPHTPTSAAWTFFIPVASMYSPFPMMKELRRWADPELFPPAPVPETRRDAGYRDAAILHHDPAPSPPAPVGWWWTFWMPFSLLSSGLDAALHRSHPWLGSLHFLIHLGAGVLAIQVIHGLDARLREQHRRARSASLDEPQPLLRDGALVHQTAMILPLVVGACGLLGFYPFVPSSRVVTILGGALTIALAACAAGAIRRLGVKRPRASVTFAIASCLVVGALPTTAIKSWTAARLSAAEGMEQHLEEMERQIVGMMEGSGDVSDARAELSLLRAAIEAKPALLRTPRGDVARCDAEAKERHGELLFQKLTAERMLAGPLDIPAGPEASDLDDRIARTRAYAEAMSSYPRYLRTRNSAEKECLLARGIGEKEATEIADERLPPVSENLLKGYDIEARWSATAIDSLSLLRANLDRTSVRNGARIFSDPRATARWNSRLDERGAIERESVALRRSEEAAGKPVEEEGLVAARQRAGSHLARPTDQGEWPAAPAGMMTTAYKSALGPMKAFISRASSGKAPVPAVLWVPSVSELEVDMAAAEALSAKGVLVLLPTVRGTYGNPGAQEIEFGEIDDLLAARDTLARFPRVGRTHVVGIGSGGTRVALMAAARARPGTMVALGGTLDFVPLQPDFPALSRRDLELRSAVRFAEHVKGPFYFISRGFEVLSPADEMAERAARNGGKMNVLACKFAGRCDVHVLVALVLQRLAARPDADDLELDDAALLQADPIPSL